METGSEFKLINYRQGLPQIAGLTPEEAILVDPVAFYRLLARMTQVSQQAREHPELSGRILTEILDRGCNHAGQSNNCLTNPRQNEAGK